MERLTKFEILDVDELRIRVLVENSIQLGDRRYRALHGLSMLVQTRCQDQWSNVLLDVGSDPDVLFGNMEAMGLSPSSVDCIVLSHNHWDHTTGLPEVIRKIGKPGLSVVTHPASARVTFRHLPHISGGIVRDVGLAEIEAAGGSLLAFKEPVEVAPGLFTTGYVERVTGEPTGIAANVLEPDGTWHEDDIADDMSLVARVKGLGLVIMTGCAHAGVVNILRHCLRIAGETKVHAIIGGFHLVAADEKRVAWTISEFGKIQPDLIASGHCTGFDAEAAFRQAFGKKYTHMTVGTRFAFPG